MRREQSRYICLFFFNDTATTEIYTLSLHDALPIYPAWVQAAGRDQDIDLWPVALQAPRLDPVDPDTATKLDRKSTRLNSSHSQNSYAVFCLKKKKRPGGADVKQRPADGRRRFHAD